MLVQELKPSGKGVILRPEVASPPNHNRWGIDTVRSNIYGQHNVEPKNFGKLRGCEGFGGVLVEGVLSTGGYRGSPEKLSFK